MITVIGLGYIGLPTSLMFAAHGNKVTGVDYNRELVKSLQNKSLPFEEKGLLELFDKAFDNMTFTCEYLASDVYIIAVPTPYDKENKRIDPKYIIGAIQDVLRVCPQGAIVVIESTVSPGTIDRYVRPVIEEAGFVIGKDLHLVHAPERIIPGNMVYELKHNSRTIGCDDYEIGNWIKDLYASFCEGEIIVTDIKTAEMTKVVENTFRDINIAFANELAQICRNGGMDVYEIIRIANKHPRVNILTPGPGVGGHCISVDPWFLVGDYPNLTPLIQTARKVNDNMPLFILERITQICKEHNNMDLSRVGLYGLTYKEDVDDVRESPTLQLLAAMKKNNLAELKVYDPWVKRDLVPHQYHDLTQFLDDVDFVVVLVGHSEIKNDLEVLSDKIVLDTRNIGKDNKFYSL